jgi:hypothetical protein
MTEIKKVYQDRIKFYADSESCKNKFFCFKINSILDYEKTLKNFISKGFNIRACWYEKINIQTGEIIENIRQPNLNSLIDRLIDELRQPKKNMYSDLYDIAKQKIFDKFKTLPS